MLIPCSTAAIFIYVYMQYSSNISPQAIYSIFISPRYVYFFRIVTEDGYCTVAETYDCFFNNLASVRQVEINEIKF